MTAKPLRFCRHFFWLAFLALSACAAPLSSSYLETAAGPSPAPERFRQCHGYACHVISDTGLTAEEWASVRALFTPPPENAERERLVLAEAVGRWRTLVGEKTGTHRNRPGAPLNFFDDGQMDCVDETVNTTTSLRLLSEAGLLRYHTPASPAVRGQPLLFTIHHTAVIADKTDGALYALDPWQSAMGEPARLVPLALWRQE